MGFIEAIKEKTGFADDLQAITSFEKMELSISGMRGSSGYLAKHVGEDVFVEFYKVRHGKAQVL